MGDMVPMVNDDDEVPPSLCIVLTKKELDALELDDNADIGDMVHFTGLGRVTAVNKQEAQDYHVEAGQADAEGEPMVRIEIEIVALGLQDESHEDDEEEMPLGANVGSALFGD